MQLKSQNYTLLRQGEADDLPQSAARRRWNRRPIWQWIVPGLLAVTVVLALVITRAKVEKDVKWDHHSNLPACPQYPALKAASSDREKLEKEVKDAIDSDKFFEKSLKNMQGAVQIPTESFDDMGPVGNDTRWDIFKDFHKYLEETFPLVYSKLEFTPINTYGILLEWKGKDTSLKPYLFMGHQDVVPVLKVTESRWKYPPYSAYYDGRFVWGRGASDCKNVVIGVLEAFETLLEKNFIPERTIMAGFGFDEEISGPQGAQFIARHLEETKGKGSIDLIIDEGGLGIKDINGATFALPGLGEKGYFDARITVETAGGHSSVPPDHTGIGILSQIISAIEANPYEPDLTPVNPYYTTLQCTAQYSPDMDSWLRKTIQKALSSKKAAKTVADYIASQDISQRYLMQTSQATDLISGGVKINALPEKVYAVVNHRIAVESRVKDVRANLKSVIESKILPKFPLSLDAWGEVSGNTSASSVGQIFLENFDEPLEPSPVSPFDTDAYKIFTGTIKQVMGEDVIVAPSLMTGNTDTKFYWNLSKNIYRFAPVRDGGRENAHTVDERIGMKEHVEGVRFYAQLILNSDRS
ncbi:related to CPS1-Gly-X carboxypeptidase YSCS precursor [Phialocephala subalpina]|uniref:Related to CPS1-Gly-X carboxypeptidase YSCS n=1 Tax=Phialocephala subalpina TaxID=576137 RepID=A0A1L7XRW0_9HELO|nr:related to CPS1-Gly-X carboxypeptidase YSCS precursor [Phialocephala subalpina]